MIVNVTQCSRGMVTANYATGRALKDAGITAGADLTAETALVKLGWLIGQGLPAEEVRRRIGRNLRGEQTEVIEGTRFSLQDKSFVQSVYQALVEAGAHTSRPASDMHAIQQALFPVLLCSAAGMGDASQLETMLKQGARVDSADYDGRTALHVAASEGHAEVVELLLRYDAGVNAVDRWKSTPLQDAVRHGHSECAALLERAGASLADANNTTAMLEAASEGSIVKVQALLRHGASPNTADYGAWTKYTHQLSRHLQEVPHLLPLQLIARYAGNCP